MQEYERRFLIPGLKWRACDVATPYNDESGLYKFGVNAGEAIKVATVRDMYLRGLDDTPPLRHRTQRYRAERPTYELCTKLGKAPDRHEHRWPSGPTVDGETIGTVAKVRFAWERGPLKLHIEYVLDCRNVGGWVAECEGPPDAVRGFVSPITWFEVTGAPEYSNLALATKGWPK